MALIIDIDDDLRVNGMSAESFGRSLPLKDPIKAQKTVCEAVSRLVQDDQPGASQLGALLVFDRHAQQIRERLLLCYVEGDAQLQPHERKYWQSALRLSQSFFSAYEHFLRVIQTTTDDSWLEPAKYVLVRLFHHRQGEFLLRLLRYKKRNSGQWRALHETYDFARDRGLTTHPVAFGQADGKHGKATTLEQQYIQILLLEMMNCGQFSPREALWASGWFRRWCSALTLQSCLPGGVDRAVPQGFVVDLGGIEGLKRTFTEATGNLLCLDPLPLALAIDEEIASLRDSVTQTRWSAPVERDGQVALLSKLKVLFAPSQVRIERRGERKPVAQTVQVIAGLPNIVQVLREQAKNEERAISSSSVHLEGETLSPSYEQTCMSTIAAGDVASGALFSNGDAFGAIQRAWQVKDRSDSGCRMRGQTDDLNRTIPGSVVAIRDSDNSPWTVTVVRRFRRLMIDHVEIGVEHIGRRPRFVKIVTDYGLEPSVDALPDRLRRCFGALYLPPSEEHPTMPIKTLLLPAREFKAGCNVTLLSSSATYTLRLNEPIQQHLEFVWTSFTIIDKLAATSVTKGSIGVVPKKDGRFNPTTPPIEIRSGVPNAD